jgi:thioredoxin reductase
VSSPSGWPTRPSASAPSSPKYEAVEHIGRAKGQSRLRTGKRELRAAGLILALGLGRLTPRKLGLASEDRFLGSGLTYRLPQLAEITAKRVLMVGGGDSAVDTALSREGLAEVTLVNSREALRALAHSQARLRDSGVRLLTNAEVASQEMRQ